VFMFPQLS